MTPEELIKLLEERGDVVYVIDKGLIQFGKFAVALSAMFVLFEAAFFGFDVKKASDEAKQARFDTEKTLLSWRSGAKGATTCRFVRIYGRLKGLSFSGCFGKGQPIEFGECPNA